MSLNKKIGKLRAVLHHGKGVRGRLAVAGIFCKNGGLLPFKKPARLLSLQTPWPGAPFLKLRDNAGDAILFSEVLAEEDYAILRTLDLQPKCVFDIGANIGLASFFLKTLYPEVRIYGFEPSPEEHEILEKNYAEWSGCTALPYAVGDHESDDVRFAANPDKTGGQHLAACGEEGEWNYIQVKMRRIDKLIQNADLPVPDLVKMDIEGGEVNALCGMGDYIDKPAAYILETHSASLHEQCLGKLKVCGYQVRLDVARNEMARILCLTK
jgi:FkbM family methyltransferase